jgi:GTP-binding protein
MLKKAVFFKATSEVSSLPNSMAEVILSGRSNVGKSSVINALCAQKSLARVSKTPGKTRSVNIYSVAMKKWIIDLPGYGFAKVSFEEKKLWNKMIEECIVQRKNKKVIYIVIDAFVGPTQLDFDMVYWLNDYAIPFKIVMNKCDKLYQSIMQNDMVKSEVAKRFDIDIGNIFTVSAKKCNGFTGLRFDVINFLNC